MGINIRELRGIRNLVIAPLTTDTAEEITYGAVVPFAGAKEIGNEVEESSATSYYDNKASIVTSAEGSDTYGIVCSVLEDKVKATIEGRKYDEATGAYMGTPLARPYVAIGFIGKDTDGKEYGYWVYKCKLTGGAEKYITEDDGTETVNLEYEAVSIYTEHVFVKADKKPLKYYKVDLEKVGGEEKFFAKVENPDTISQAMAMMSAKSR